MILSESEAAVADVPIVLPDIAQEAEVVVVASPTRVLDFVPDSDIETEPSEAPPSPVYASGSPDYAHASDDDTKLLKVLASPEYSPGLDTESDPSEAGLEELEEEDSSEEDSSDDDTFEADEPLPTQISAP
ncbi:hypothetical protein Tco_1447701 [Tanacetum coccineum]